MIKAVLETRRIQKKMRDTAEAGNAEPLFDPSQPIFQDLWENWKELPVLERMSRILCYITAPAGNVEVLKRHVDDEHPQMALVARSLKRTFDRGGKPEVIAPLLATIFDGSEDGISDETLSNLAAILFAESKKGS